MKNKKISITDMVVGIAAIVGLIGIFLPWASISAFGISVTARGTDGNGWICLIMFIAILGVVCYNIYKKFEWTKLCVTIAAGIAFLIAIINLFDVTGSGLPVGIGLILTVLASLACGIMPWIPLGKKVAKKEK